MCKRRFSAKTLFEGGATKQATTWPNNQWNDTERYCFACMKLKIDATVVKFGNKIIVITVDFLSYRDLEVTAHRTNPQRVKNSILNRRIHFEDKRLLNELGSEWVSSAEFASKVRRAEQEKKWVVWASKWANSLVLFASISYCATVRKWRNESS